MKISVDSESEKWQRLELWEPLKSTKYKVGQIDGGLTASEEIIADADKRSRNRDERELFARRLNKLLRILTEAAVTSISSRAL